jgi:ABC-2 type transport system ATP-binding protein
MTTSNALTVEALRVARGERVVIHDLSMRIRPGKIMGLVGPNGSGKSTLMRAIAGVLAPVSGAIEIGGFSILKDEIPAKQQLGFAPDIEQLPPGLTVRQVLQLCVIARLNSNKAPIPEQTFSQSKLLGLDRYLDSFISTLSLGSRQKVVILIALMESPACIVLDEVFNGLDPKSSFQLKQILRQLKAKGSSILLATHGLELAADLLDEMVLLEDGKLKAAWDEQEFARIRSRGGSALEAAIVAALD